MRFFLQRAAFPMSRTILADGLFVLLAGLFCLAALNGTLVTGEMELHDGDVIAASSQDGTKTAMPLTVEIGG